MIGEYDEATELAVEAFGEQLAKGGLDYLFDRPMAAEGLISYRYAGPYGGIKIGAKDVADALNEASRSTDAPVSIERLEVWNGEQWLNVGEVERGKAMAAERKRAIEAFDAEFGKDFGALKLRATQK